MSTFGITRSLNEVDIIDGSIRRMLTQVDHVIIGDNSTDGTRAALEALVDEQLPVTLLDDHAQNWQQRDVMTQYAQIARGMGADWVIPFDIDELWHADQGRVADRLAELPPTILVARCTLLTHCVTPEDDPTNPDPMSRMGWRNVEALPLPKVACRVREDLRVDHGNHAASYDNVPHVPLVDGVLGARHFPYRSPEQFVKRVQGAWPMLRDSGLPESHGAHMWGYGRLLDDGGPEALVEWFNTQFVFPNPSENPQLVYDPAPGCR